MRTLVIDIGGNTAKYSLGDVNAKQRTGTKFTPELLRTYSDYDQVAIGYPGVVVDNKIIAEPNNLGTGWVGFDFEKHFGAPVRIVNDAVMQALGAYNGGRMLFLGFGTGLGACVIDKGKITPLELGFDALVGIEVRSKSGKKEWQWMSALVANMLIDCYKPDYCVLGGGNARHLGSVNDLCVLGGNEDAIVGGLRMWDKA